MDRQKKAITPKVLVLVAALLSATAATAETAVCTGKVTRIFNHSPGGFYLALEGLAIVKACDFDAEYSGFSPADCKHMASLAALALATEKELSIWIDNAPTTACSSVPSWHSAQTRALAIGP